MVIFTLVVIYVSFGMVFCDEPYAVLKSAKVIKYNITNIASSSSRMSWRNVKIANG